MAEVQAPHPKSTQAVPDLMGMTVGRFAVRARMPKGGMSEVYLADDTKLKRPVVLKRMSAQLRADEHYRQRFLKEAEYASCLTDQHIASIYDVLEAGGETLLVMEYVEGTTLRPRLTQPFSLEEFLPVAIQCAEALAVAHEKGIIHRDIKPENIMLTPKGQVKILDFGVAKRLPHLVDDASTASTTSQPGTLTGTLPYMAPEVLMEKPAAERSDIFSLGVVFYEMLAGQHPFRADSFVATSDRIRHEVPPPLGQLNPKVPVGLERLVAKMLAKDPSERYAKATELVTDLRALEQKESRLVRLLTALRRWVRRRRSVILVVLGVVLLAVAGPPLYRRIRDWIHQPPLPEKVHLAVLQFVTLGGTPESSAFGSGLTVTLNAQLMQLTERHNLQVVPASAIQTHGIRTLEQARQEFGVNMVLEGNVQQAAGKIRITYALIDAATRRQLRADIITAGAGDPFATEDEVVASVLRNLEIELQPRERSALAARGTQQPVAYDYYLRGRGYLQDYHRPENIENAIAAFKQALENDTQYPLAYAGVGEAYWHKYQLTRDPQWVRQALASCERAVTLDARLSSGHTCLGVVYNGTGKYGLAIEQFRQAVELEPTSDAAHRGLASAYESQGRAKDAEETYLHAIKLRPQYWAGYSWLGAFYYWHARYAEAAKMFDQVVSLAPASFRGYSNLGTIYNAQGRYAEAIVSCEHSLGIRPTGDAYSNKGTAYFGLRRFAEAAQAYEEAVRMEAQEYLWWGNLGDARYWTPGQRAQAASAYQHAISLAQEDLRVNPREVRTLGFLAYYYAVLGDRQAARSCLGRALAVAPNNPELLFNAALAHNQLGDRDEALAWLEKALAAGISPAALRDNPFLDNLRTDTRYLALLQRHQP
jgi:tetratricopeptide (TPR) repeat protein/tRNA A-37 threonylcarbamoyl transferase component Bud32